MAGASPWTHDAALLRSSPQYPPFSALHEWSSTECAVSALHMYHGASLFDQKYASGAAPPSAPSI